MVHYTNSMGQVSTLIKAPACIAVDENSPLFSQVTVHTPKTLPIYWIDACGTTRSVKEIFESS